MLRSPLRSTIIGAYDLWTLLIERLLNIKTCQSISGPGAAQNLAELRGLFSARALYNDNIHYEALDYRTAWRVIRVLELGSEDVLYDIGCGKGRFLCVAARQRTKKVIGVELFEELCLDARQNALALRGRKTPIEVICADAAKVDYSDGTVFFLWNPFGEMTLRSVIQSIRASMATAPRSIRIGYANPVHEHVLDAESWLERYDVLRVRGGPQLRFWRSKPA